MMAYLVVAILVSAVVYGLERNRRVQVTPPPRLTGSCDVQDRDAERTRAELRARLSGQGGII
ncbi:MAG: hypothetical protein WBA97_33070 [Actinophytocola sp.]|uniref:hypothetical protein n=1 Tax=Actinophytocola sp. TaxID=1872138 RepID=UPI003C77A89F